MAGFNRLLPSQKNVCLGQYVLCGYPDWLWEFALCLRISAAKTVSQKRTEHFIFNTDWSITVKSLGPLYPFRQGYWQRTAFLMYFTFTLTKAEFQGQILWEIQFQIQQNLNRLTIPSNLTTICIQLYFSQTSPYFWWCLSKFFNKGHIQDWSYWVQKVG